MTDSLDPRGTHPGDEALIERLDGSAGPDAPATAAHLTDCAACRARSEALEALLADLAIAPPAPTATVLAAQRERIAAAVRARPRDGRRSRRPWRGWIPLAAAAGLAALLVLARSGSPPAPGPVADSPAAGAVAELPIDAAAESAAEAAVVALADPAEVTLLERADSDAGSDLPADADPLLARARLEAELAELPVEDQAAILAELETITFDL